jgi:hypothetical protein
MIKVSIASKEKAQMSISTCEKLLIEHENRKNADNVTGKSAGVRTGYFEVPNKHTARLILFWNFFPTYVCRTSWPY